MSPKVARKAEPKCDCGRLQSKAVWTVMRSHDRRFVFHRCECGREWTVTEAVSDHDDPVSSDEVIEVHRFLSDPDLPLHELLRRRPDGK